MKMRLLLFVLFVLMFLAAFIGVTIASNDRFLEISHQDNGYVCLKIYKDRKTGVHYLILDNKGITPLLNSDGKPYIHK